MTLNGHLARGNSEIMALEQAALLLAHENVKSFALQPKHCGEMIMATHPR
jgi:hypothetical protein